MRFSILPVLACLALAGCNDDPLATNDPAAGSGSADEEAAPAAATSAGKPAAPIAIDYDVIGTPVVGQPVGIDVRVRATSGDAPVRLSYRVLDPQSMTFPDTQARELALRVTQREPAVRQVTVVPQREGRLYLNVTAEVDTADGTLLRSIAIPVQVGSAGPARQEPGGILKQEPGGETVISLPADEG
ncbi:MAG TPA: hypothetical protein VKZ85_03390 [Woeseiaceae bacterium]|nr:hypothetical protein [Woeseiaceae bacterium]